MLSPERAQYLCENRLMGGEYRMAFRPASAVSNADVYEDGMTESEFRHVQEVWELNPSGSSTFDGTVRQIAEQNLKNPPSYT